MQQATAFVNLVIVGHAADVLHRPVLCDVLEFCMSYNVSKLPKKLSSSSLTQMLESKMFRVEFRVGQLLHQKPRVLLYGCDAHSVCSERRYTRCRYGCKVDGTEASIQRLSKKESSVRIASFRVKHSRLVPERRKTLFLVWARGFL